MINPKSILAGIDLANRYRSITKDNIIHIAENKSIDENTAFFGLDIMWDLTGFCSPGKCTICESIYHICSQCYYSSNAVDITEPNNYCWKSVNSQTFYAIKEAFTISELLSALTARAEHILSIINNINLKDIDYDRPQ